MMLQSEKAELFRKQHSGPKLLLLPNVWDTLTAKLMASLGFPSLATASISVATVNGYPDGEQIPLHSLLEVVSKITSAVDLPVSVDFERGFASSNRVLKENIQKLLETGAIGINIEDGLADKSELVPLAEQCKKIEIIRETAVQYGVNLVINARTDVYLQKKDNNLLADTIQRGKAYQHAGADCFYPILINNFQDLEALLNEVTVPVNVLLTKPIGDLKRLEQMGVKRVSLGPGTLKYVLTKLKSLATDLQNYQTDRFFMEDLISNEELNSLIK